MPLQREGILLCAALLGLSPFSPAIGQSPAPAYRADRSSLPHPAPAAASAQLPSRLEAYEPRPEPVAAAPAAEPEAVARKPILDVWERIRAGHALPELDNPLVVQWQAWYLNRPQLLKAMLERSRRYVYHVVDELDKRGMPAELALLPMVESGYNPMALSSAEAAGLWQFIPSTGKTYRLEQNHLYDARRDVIASTTAALDYLQALHRQFGDWQLALAAYNWGENAVGRAIERNKARGRPADYGALVLPEETRNYIPKLQALKNIVADPAAFRLELEPVPNRPYFATVASARDLELKVAAKLAGVPLEEFLALNPAHNVPTISRNAGVHIVVPVDKLESFVSRLESYAKKSPPGDRTIRSKKSQDRNASITYLVKAGETLAAIALKFSVAESQLRTWNPLVEAGLQAGQRLHLYLR